MIAMATAACVLVSGEAFNGVRILENTVRLVTMIVGFPVALVCVKFGLKALWHGEPDRAWGTLSYACMLLVPAVGRAMSFNNPINWVTTTIYIAGLIAAGIAFAYRGHWEAWWTRKRSARPQEKPGGSSE